MPELHETHMGVKLIEYTLPEIAKQLKRIADVLESKHDPADQIASAFQTFIKSYPNDGELGKQIRHLYGK